MLPVNLFLSIAVAALVFDIAWIIGHTVHTTYGCIGKVAYDTSVGGDCITAMAKTASLTLVDVVFGAEF